MRETDLLSHIYRRSADLSAAYPRILVGPGDDCAVITSPWGGGDRLLLKVDQLVEGRHFVPAPATPLDLIARKAIARAVSDIAAMAGAPTAALAAATLPAGCTYANELFDHLARWARHWSCPLVGGDIAAWSTPGAGLVLSLTVVGTPHPRRGPVLRSTARPGDHVYVTGPLGGSLDAATGLGRHLTFEPRLHEAARLGDTLGDHLHAMMDISDGLGIDAGRLADASGVRIELDAASIPLNPGIRDWRRAAGDGEDYELLFTTDQSPPLGIRIGRVAEGNGCVVIEGNQTIDVTALGFDHGRPYSAPPPRHHE